MLTSQNKVIKEIYTPAELNANKKNPTVGSQFRSGLKKLMCILYAKEPSYIRCIKPNIEKAPSNLKIMHYICEIYALFLARFKKILL